MNGLTHVALLQPPYRILENFGGSNRLRTLSGARGVALVWQVQTQSADADAEWLSRRPGGVALIAVLPPAGELATEVRLAHHVQRCRPCGILPHAPISPGDLAQVLRRPPTDLAAEATEYLTWRGIIHDSEMRQLLRRIFELSAELRSITALSRGMYLSRRALGRRLLKGGLPVPSRWLQIARILRVIGRLQNSDQSVFTIASEAGYPDGFSLSNQMQRVVGARPTSARRLLGWEWVLESWLRLEADQGGLTMGRLTASDGHQADLTYTRDRHDAAPTNLRREGQKEA